MVDLTVPGQSLSAHAWGWLILMGIILAWTLYHLVFLPKLKKKKILESVPYCPSLLLPPFSPERNREVLIQSSKLAFINYRVNLGALTCTCSRFRHIRGHYPPNDIRRLCRHLRKELETTQCLNHFDELTQGLIKHRLRDSCYVREPLARSEMIVGFHPRSSLIRIYTYRQNPDEPADSPHTGPVDKFTYNAHQDVWISGEPPPDSEEILTAVKRIMASCRARIPNAHLVPVLEPEPLTPVEESDKETPADQRPRRKLTTTPLR